MTLATKTEFSKTELGFRLLVGMFREIRACNVSDRRPTRVSEGKCLFPASRARLTPVANP